MYFQNIYRQDGNALQIHKRKFYALLLKILRSCVTHVGNYTPKNSSNLEQTFQCLIVPRTRVKIGAFYGLLAILSPSNDIKVTFIDGRSK